MARRALDGLVEIQEVDLDGEVRGLEPKPERLRRPPPAPEERTHGERAAHAEAGRPIADPAEDAEPLLPLVAAPVAVEVLVVRPLVSDGRPGRGVDERPEVVFHLGAEQPPLQADVDRRQQDVVALERGDGVAEEPDEEALLALVEPRADRDLGYEREVVGEAAAGGGPGPEAIFGEDEDERAALGVAAGGRVERRRREPLAGLGAGGRGDRQREGREQEQGSAHRTRRGSASTYGRAA